MFWVDEITIFAKKNNLNRLSTTNCFPNWSNQSLLNFIKLLVMFFGILYYRHKKKKNV